jgi:uncharacterized protein (DUF433 family)
MAPEACSNPTAHATFTAWRSARGARSEPGLIVASSVQGKARMNWKDRIVIDPDILVGKPVVKGTRLAVEFIVGLLADGWTRQQVLDNYPGVTVEDIQACLAYAADILRAEKVYPLKA